MASGTVQCREQLPSFFGTFAFFVSLLAERPLPAALHVIYMFPNKQPLTCSSATPSSSFHSGWLVFQRRGSSCFGFSLLCSNFVHGARGKFGCPLWKTKFSTWNWGNMKNRGDTVCCISQLANHTFGSTSVECAVFNVFVLPVSFGTFLDTSNWHYWSGWNWREKWRMSVCARGGLSGGLFAVEHRGEKWWRNERKLTKSLNQCSTTWNLNEMSRARSSRLQQDDRCGKWTESVKNGLVLLPSPAICQFHFDINTQWELCCLVVCRCVLMKGLLILFGRRRWAEIWGVVLNLGDNCNRKSMSELANVTSLTFLLEEKHDYKTKPNCF
jgi:hypothetical protein